MNSQVYMISSIFLEKGEKTISEINHWKERSQKMNQKPYL